MNTYFLSLGSNIHPRHRYIDEACRLLDERCGTITRRSSDYFSLPVGYRSEHEYLNICVRLDSALSPFDLLAATQQIERELGRTHKSTFDTSTQTFNYQDRTIDIDLLQAFVPLHELDFEHSFVPDSEHSFVFESALYAELHLHTDVLTLPHPRMAERDFVLRPLSEISNLTIQIS
ncbi:MAG: 2-amino-4-hydroxy-6-hydroxymethyldihydropteridine diphosphokinase [Paludibacteraceae bacterium]|nr:2-amino-4-hydroxy-6-hydroxymethyldihydropteridine diphosphokinase [Paludibacteraceae bacterium]